MIFQETSISMKTSSKWMFFIELIFTYRKIIDMLRLVLVIVALCLLVSCKQKSDFKKHNDLWQNREIKFPDKLNTKIFGRDTSCSMLQSKYKILVYINQYECTSCKLKLPSWTKLIREADSLKYDVSFLFVCGLKNFEEIEFLQKENNFNYPFIYDSKDEINKLNNFPESFPYQTFLIDNNNRVLLLGNPVFIPHLWADYKNVMNKIDE